MCRERPVDPDPDVTAALYGLLIGHPKPGVSADRVARATGISRDSLYKRARGDLDTTIGEAVAICRYLRDFELLDVAARAAGREEGDPSGAALPAVTRATLRLSNALGEFAGDLAIHAEDGRLDRAELHSLRTVLLGLVQQSEQLLADITARLGSDRTDRGARKGAA